MKRYTASEASGLLARMGEDAFVTHLLERYEIAARKPIERSVFPTKSTVLLAVGNLTEKYTQNEAYAQGLKEMPFATALLPDADNGVISTGLKPMPSEAFIDGHMSQVFIGCAREPKPYTCAPAIPVQESEKWKLERTPRMSVYRPLRVWTK
jgi:hypothetical protein